MPKEETKESGIRFFGEIDCNDHTGEIRSNMPAWYFDVQIEELSEGIGRKQRMIDAGLIDPDQVPRMKNEIAGEKARLEAIESSRPKLEGKYLDMAANAYESLSKQIKDSMPTRKQTKDGLVSPHDELKRLNTKHIKISPEVAKACGVKAYRGHISGNEANKCFQILGKALGESTNVESLRRDGNSEAYQSMHDLTQAILRGGHVGEINGR